MDEIDPDVPLFGVTKELWMELPLEHRIRGHKLAREFLDACERLGI